MSRKLQKVSRQYSSFFLDKTEKHILEYIGKNGPSNISQVGKGISRRSPYKSVRQIGRDIKELVIRGFLQITKSKKIRNLDKKEKWFGFTFKGFLAVFNRIEIKNNYLFQKYLLLLDESLDKSVTKFVTLYIKEFLLYHKGIGFRLDDINDLSNYVRKILYNHSSIKYNSKSQKELEEIEKEIYIIDEIRDIISDIKNYDHIDDESYFKHSGLNLFEEDITEEVFEESSNDQVKEFEKNEFLINFWPNVIEGIGNGVNMEKEIYKLEQNQSPINSEYVKEDIFREHKLKMKNMNKQWSNRKLNFLKLTQSRL